MQYRIFFLSFVLLSLLLAVNAYSAVELYDVRAVSTTVYYTLNTMADVTIQILPADQYGNPTGPAIYTVTFTSQSRGDQMFTWLGTRDDGSPAAPGYYAARVTANNVQPQWDPIIGIYRNDDWDTESSGRPLPGVPDTEGFYGIGINKNPASAYYGNIYVAHKAQKDILMYGPSGNPLGTFDDSSIAWGASAPWDLAVADDGYVYVCDRSTSLIYCFTPDGDLVSTSPPLTSFKAIFARTTSDGWTHIFASGAWNGIREIIVQPDHVTWNAPIIIYDTGGGDGWDAYGMWVSPDLQTLYQACNQGPNVGLTRWLRQPGGTYLKDTGWSSNVGACIDVDVNGLGNPTEFLWVTKMVAYGTGVRAIHKVNATTGNTYYPPNADYDIVTWALMCCADGVGNVAVTFGKNTPSWAQRYWGLFAEPGVSTAQKTVPISRIACTPQVIPGSEVWTPDNTIAPDGNDSATVTFQVFDCDGWDDIVYYDVDFSFSQDPVRAMIYEPIQPDPSDPNGMTGIVTVRNIAPAEGSRCSTSYGQMPHIGIITLRDSQNQTEINDSELEVNVSGYPIPVTIRHNRVAGWYMQGAQGVAVGDRTYMSAPADANGNAIIEVSEGPYQVYAQKTGFKSQVPVNTAAPYVGDPLSLLLGPYSVAEVRSMNNGSELNFEGVCFAQPVGYAPTAAYGLGPRTDTLELRNQWYVCDPNAPANGMLCLVTRPDLAFPAQWDDPLGEDDFGNSLYIGKRPAQGETIMITGTLDTPAGHERRVLLDDSDVLTGLTLGTVARTYLNRGDLGGYPSQPVTVPVTDVAHDGMTSFSPNWGKYVQINRVTVVKIDPIGNDNPSGEPVPYALVSNILGNTTEVVLQTPETLGMSDWWREGYAPDLGCTYDIRGAGGRRNRYGNGCIRVRGYDDFIAVPNGCVGLGEDVGSVRGASVSDSVTVQGIVTAKLGSSIWIESPDRTSGVRVTANPSYVAVGDCVSVAGTIAMNDGERVIHPDLGIVPRSTGNPLPAPLDLRTREVGGSDCLNNPGVTTGRGALNVGLRVHVQGMVTGIGAGNVYYYLWDGANRSDLPVSDGNADGFIGVRIEAAPPTGVYAWQDWIDVTGVVSTDASIVPGVVAPTIIPTSASKVTAFDTITTPPGSPLRAGWDLMSVPAAPAGTSDGDEWSPKPWDDYMVLAPNQDPNAIDGRIFRWENCTGGLGIWDRWAEVGVHGWFGGLILGDGYWLQIDEDWPVSYSGRGSSLDQWIGICHEGWMILGHPKDHNTSLADAKVHTGDRVISMYDAVLTENWIDCMGYWWDETNQGLTDIGIPDCWASTDTLRPWHGYWLQVNRGDLALIVPDSPMAP